MLAGSPWQSLGPAAPTLGMQRRSFCLSRRLQEDQKRAADGPRLTHVSEYGDAHMVSISDKAPSSRRAVAACTVRFSGEAAPRLIRDNQMRKGDVLGVARVAGIMAAKRTADLIPLCHPVAISHAAVDLDVVAPAPAAAAGAEGPGSSTQGQGHGLGEWRVEVRATVTCDGKTGVEMEALTAAATAALTVYDMCKAVDKGMVVEGLRVVLKEGGKSGRWEME